MSLSLSLHVYIYIYREPALDEDHGGLEEVEHASLAARYNITQHNITNVTYQ